MTVGILPNVNSKSLNRDVNSVTSAHLHRGKWEGQPSKKTKNYGDNKCSGHVERCTTVGLRISGHRAGGIFNKENSENIVLLV